MTRTTRLSAIALATALGVAACGGGSSGTTDTTSSETGAGSSSSAAVDLTGQTLEVAAVWTGEEQASFEAVLREFEDTTGAAVQFTSTGDDIATVLGTRIQGGDPPDVAVLPQPGLLAQFAQDGALQPLGDDIVSLVDDNYAPVWKDLGTVDGQLYGVWFKAANKSTVWYRTDAFDQAGVEPPATWDDLMSAAQTISDSGTTPVSIGGGDGWTLTDWFENVYLRVAGPDKYDQLTKHEIPWTDDSVKTTLQTLAQLWGQDNLIVGGASGALQDLFPDSVTNVFGDGASGALVYEGDFVAGVISSETSAVVGQDAKFFSFPSVNGSDPAVVGGGDVAVAMTDSQGATELLKYLASPEAAQIWASRGGYTSPNKNLDSSVYPDDTQRAIAEALVNADTFRFDMSDQEPAEFGGTPAQGEWKILQDFLADTSNIDGTAQALEDAAAAAYGN